VFALCRSAHEAWLTAAAHTMWRDPRRGRRDMDTCPDLGDLTATDSAGHLYTLMLGGGGTDTWQEGRLAFSPRLPSEVAWLDIRVRDGDPTRIALDTSAASDPRIATRDLTLDPVERYVQVTAEQALLSWPAREGSRMLAATVRAFLAVGAFRSGSALPGQVAQLCERAGWPGHGIDAVRPTGLPGHWVNFLGAASSGGLRYRGDDDAHPPPSVAALPLALPEIDGARIALAALVNRGKITELYGSFCTPDRAASVASCWLLDDGGQWHIAIPGTWSSNGKVCVMSQVTVFPPVPLAARAVEIVAAGATTEVRATLPLAWRAP
jgi:hypothetical protein